jgi:succinate dehydrogenase/fumarate reductase flavoprotein subunit
MAPQAILELVDGKRDMHFSMTARRVARSSILGTKWLSESTRDGMYRIFKFRGEDRVKEFDDEVERQKRLLEREDNLYEAWRKFKEDKPVKEIEDRLDERMQYTAAYKMRKLPRFKARFEEKRRKEELKKTILSEEEKEQIKKEQKEEEQNARMYKLQTRP